MVVNGFTKYLCPDLSHPVFFPSSLFLPSFHPSPPPPLSLSPQTYGSLHYRWVCLRRQGKALRVWWILYIIKLHFFSIQTSLHYKGNQPQQPYEHKCEQRPAVGSFELDLRTKHNPINQELPHDILLTGVFSQLRCSLNVFSCGIFFLCSLPAVTAVLSLTAVWNCDINKLLCRADHIFNWFSRHQQLSDLPLRVWMSR